MKAMGGVKKNAASGEGEQKGFSETINNPMSHAPCDEVHKLKKLLT